jgi:hypothetical protein
MPRESPARMGLDDRRRYRCKHACLHFIPGLTDERQQVLCSDKT